MTLSEIKKALDTNHVSRKKDGSYRYWVSYFYSNGLSSEKLVEAVKREIPNAVIIDNGDHWHDFVGGAKSGTARDSFMYVIFEVK